ncbi:MAG: hypothetical protein WC701_14600, partial [Kiritimatiellales bacterium]
DFDRHAEQRIAVPLDHPLLILIKWKHIYHPLAQLAGAHGDPEPDIFSSPNLCELRGENLNGL